MNRLFSLAVLAVMLALPTVAWAAGDAITGEVQKQPLNVIAIAMFLLFICGTMGITYWASKKTTSSNDFYTAGGGISGFQNGLAIAGDYMSAAAFLGLSGMVYMKGVDGVFYIVGWTVGWPLILFLIAERLRNLGKFTFADVASYRLAQTPIRSLAASGALAVVIFYLIAQMVGAGKLIQLLFGMDYAYAVVMVGVLMVGYVLFGGMLATTWVQIIKACLLLGGCTIMMILGLVYFNFDFGQVMQAAVANSPRKAEMLTLSPSIGSDWFTSISLFLALMCGPAGLPHVLMRFFTVPDAKEARKSVFYATGFVGYFFIVAVTLGLLAVTLVGTDPSFMENGKLIGGVNMAAIHLANKVGGNVLLGFISAVAFATILAVVSGLALAGASAVSHDLFAQVFFRGRTTERQEMLVSRTAVVTLGVLAVILGLLFESQNIAFMVSLAFGLAASVNFPVLFLSILWKGLTTRGAFIGGFIGLITAVACVVLGPAVWVQVLHFEHPIFPFEQYTLLSMGLAFVSIWFFSITDNSERAKIDREGYAHQRVRSETGLGAAGASAH